MTDALRAPIRFDEGYMARMWGGDRLARMFGKPVPSGQRTGEAWLISDHPQHESRVVDGPLAGASLRDLLDSAPKALLGDNAAPTPQDRRFPLLLKLLDAADVLSVQVHPDDGQAQALGEPDGGKTETWHVVDAAPGARLYCGWLEALDEDAFVQSARDGRIADLMRKVPVQTGDAAFIPAGTVHAIGAGLVIAELQQNSDLTYRVYDWGRVDGEGKPRTLHLDKAVRVSRLDNEPVRAGEASLAYGQQDAVISVEAACPHFVAESVRLEGQWQCGRGGRSFAILLCLDGELRVETDKGFAVCQPGDAVLVPAAASAYGCSGQAGFMHYYVGDPAQDVVAPLLSAGHAERAIQSLIHGF